MDFFSVKLYYQDTDSLYVNMDHYEKLKAAGYVENNLGQEKNRYGDIGIYYGLLLAQKMKLCYTIDKKGKLGENLTVKEFMKQKGYLTLINI